MTTQELKEHYFKVPNDIYRAVKNPYQLAILTHLLQRQNGNGNCFPSIETLQQGIMGRMVVIKNIKYLEQVGIIKISRIWGKSNTYVIDSDRILSLINDIPVHVRYQSTSDTSPRQILVNHSDQSTTATSYITLEFLEFQNVKLTKEQYGKLINKFGENTTKEWINKLSLWFASSGKTKKNHYATILNWARNEVKKPIENHNQKYNGITDNDKYANQKYSHLVIK